MDTFLFDSWQTGWIPRDLIWLGDKPVVELVELEDIGLREPFLEQTQKRATGRRRLIPLDDARFGSPGPPPAGFIYHVMRCGSTLISRVLATTPGHRVLSEPTAFQLLLTRAGVEPERQASRFRSLVQLFARGVATPPDRLFVKWWSGMCRYVSLIHRWYPETPQVFLFRDPVEVIVSCLDGPPGNVRAPLRDLLAPHLRPPDDAQFRSMPLDELMARYVASLCYWCARCPDLPVLDYTRLPTAIWTDLSSHFRLTLTSSDVAAMRAAAEIYSKDEAGRQRFVPDSEAKRARAEPALFEIVDRIVRPEWSVLLQQRSKLATSPG